MSAATLAVCLMLTEREAEHEGLAVFGVSVCVQKRGGCGCQGTGGRMVQNAKGKAAIKAQSAHPLPPISVRGV